LFALGLISKGRCRGLVSIGGHGQQVAHIAGGCMRVNSNQAERQVLSMHSHPPWQCVRRRSHGGV
jgi:hypothetical protein